MLRLIESRCAHLSTTKTDAAPVSGSLQLIVENELPLRGWKQSAATPELPDRTRCKAESDRFLGIDKQPLDAALLCLGQRHPTHPSLKRGACHAPRSQAGLRIGHSPPLPGRHSRRPLSTYTASPPCSQLPPNARINITVVVYCAVRTCSALRRWRKALRRASSSSSWLTKPLR